MCYDNYLFQYNLPFHKSKKSDLFSMAYFPEKTHGKELLLFLFLNWLHSFYLLHFSFFYSLPKFASLIANCFCLAFQKTGTHLTAANLIIYFTQGESTTLSRFVTGQQLQFPH